MSNLAILRRVLAAARAGDSPDLADLDAAAAAIADGTPAAKALQRERGKPGRKASRQYDANDLQRVAAVLAREQDGMHPAEALDRFAGSNGLRKMQRYRAFVSWLTENDIPVNMINAKNIPLFADAFHDDERDDDFLREVLLDK